MSLTKRRFVTVGDRRVHYRRAGEGPPLVMLHGSPGNSEVLAHEIAAAARHFTCFALDTPGFGDSDALPGDELQVADLADATAEAMVALGLPPCLVFGTHTGAAIGLELGARRPERVAGLILDAVPIFTESEMATLFEGAFAPMVPEPLGGHLFSTWMRFRDQFTWFPWISRDVTRLNPVDRATPEEIQLWVMMFYRSYKKYKPAYRAACYYGQRALTAAEALQVPTVFMASAEDMLFPHLERLPRLKPGQRIERLPYDPPAKYAAIVEFARALTPAAAAPPQRAAALAGTDPAVQFIDTDQGQLFLRGYGDSANPAVLLLHDAPGTGLALEALARSLAADAFVLLPDLPGNGESALDGDGDGEAILETAANAIAAIADFLGLTRITLAGIGCGAAVAACFSERGDPRLAHVLLERVPVPDEAVAAAIAPELPLRPEGAHWLQAWLMLRDGQIYQPWFDGTVAAQRRTQGNFGAQWLHDQTFALMKARTSYHLLPRAAHRYDTAGVLAHAGVPVAVAEENGLGALILETLKEDTL